MLSLTEVLQIYWKKTKGRAKNWWIRTGNRFVVVKKVTGRVWNFEL